MIANLVERSLADAIVSVLSCDAAPAPDPLTSSCPGNTPLPQTSTIAPDGASVSAPGCSARTAKASADAPAEDATLLAVVAGPVLGAATAAPAVVEAELSRSRTVPEAQETEPEAARKELAEAAAAVRQRSPQQEVPVPSALEPEGASCGISAEAAAEAIGVTAEHGSASAVDGRGSVSAPHHVVAEEGVAAARAVETAQARPASAAAAAVPDATAPPEAAALRMTTAAAAQSKDTTGAQAAAEVEEAAEVAARAPAEPTKVMTEAAEAERESAPRLQETAVGGSDVAIGITGPDVPAPGPLTVMERDGRTAEPRAADTAALPAGEGKITAAAAGAAAAAAPPPQAAKGPAVMTAEVARALEALRDVCRATELTTTETAAVLAGDLLGAPLALLAPPDCTGGRPQLCEAALEVPQQLLLAGFTDPPAASGKPAEAPVVGGAAGPDCRGAGAGVPPVAWTGVATPGLGAPAHTMQTVQQLEPMAAAPRPESAPRSPLKPEAGVVAVPGALAQVGPPLEVKAEAVQRPPGPGGSGSLGPFLVSPFSGRSYPFSLCLRPGDVSLAEQLSCPARAVANDPNRRVEAVLDEHWSSSRRTALFLVKWAGYELDPGVPGGRGGHWISEATLAHMAPLALGHWRGGGSGGGSGGGGSRDGGQAGRAVPFLPPLPPPLPLPPASPPPSARPNYPVALPPTQQPCHPPESPQQQQQRGPACEFRTESRRIIEQPTPGPVLRSQAPKDAPGHMAASAGPSQASIPPEHSSPALRPRRLANTTRSGRQRGSADPKAAGRQPPPPPAANRNKKPQPQPPGGGSAPATPGTLETGDVATKSKAEVMEIQDSKGDQVACAAPAPPGRAAGGRASGSRPQRQRPRAPVRQPAAGTKGADRGQGRAQRSRSAAGQKREEGQDTQDPKRTSTRQEAPLAPAPAPTPAPGSGKQSQRHVAVSCKRPQPEPTLPLHAGGDTGGDSSGSGNAAKHRRSDCQEKVSPDRRAAGAGAGPVRPSRDEAQVGGLPQAAQAPKDPSCGLGNNRARPTRRAAAAALRAAAGGGCTGESEGVAGAGAGAGPGSKGRGTGGSNEARRRRHPAAGARAVATRRTQHSSNVSTTTPSATTFVATGGGGRGSDGRGAGAGAGPAAAGGGRAGPAAAGGDAPGALRRHSLRLMQRSQAAAEQATQEVFQTEQRTPPEVPADTIGVPLGSLQTIQGMGAGDGGPVTAWGDHAAAAVAAGREESPSYSKDQQACSVRQRVRCEALAQGMEPVSQAGPSQPGAHDEGAAATTGGAAAQPAAVWDAAPPPPPPSEPFASPCRLRPPTVAATAHATGPWDATLMAAVEGVGAEAPPAEGPITPPPAAGLAPATSPAMPALSDRRAAAPTAAPFYTAQVEWGAGLGAAEAQQLRGGAFGGASGSRSRAAHAGSRRRPARPSRLRPRKDRRAKAQVDTRRGGAAPGGPGGPSEGPSDPGVVDFGGDGGAADGVGFPHRRSDAGSGPQAGSGAYGDKGACDGNNSGADQGLPGVIAAAFDAAAATAAAAQAEAGAQAGYASRAAAQLGSLHGVPFLLEGFGAALQPGIKPPWSGPLAPCGGLLSGLLLLQSAAAEARRWVDAGAVGAWGPNENAAQYDGGVVDRMEEHQGWPQGQREREGVRDGEGHGAQWHQQHQHQPLMPVHEDWGEAAVAAGQLPDQPSELWLRQEMAAGQVVSSDRTGRRYPASLCRRPGDTTLAEYDPALDEDSGEVERILDEVWEEGERFFLIKWKGFELNPGVFRGPRVRRDPGHWEPEENVPLDVTSREEWELAKPFWFTEQPDLPPEPQAQPQQRPRQQTSSLRSSSRKRRR